MQRIYALIGKPLGHSLSADYFNDLLNRRRLMRATYYKS